ncbi:MAG: polysaccharide deacetylase family protein [Candidatus Binatia bacterium]
MSTHQYGARRGVWNIMDVLDRHGVKATFFVCGTTAERYPETVKEMLARGHDIAGFTYNYEKIWTLSTEEEAEMIKKSISAIANVTNKHPMGWRCPDFQMSKNTLPLLVEHGLMWDSSLLNDDLPYTLQLGAHKITEVPPSMSAYDKHYLYLPNPRGLPSELMDNWTDEFDVLYQESSLQPKLMTICCHPFLVGRPAQLEKLEMFIKKALNTPGVWFATCSEIAFWWDEQDDTPGPSEKSTM